MGLAILSIQTGLHPPQSIGAVLEGKVVPGQTFSKLPLAPAEPLLLRELNYRHEGVTSLARFLSETQAERDHFCDHTVVPHVFDKAPGPAAEFLASLHQTGGHAWKILNGR